MYGYMDMRAASSWDEYRGGYRGGYRMGESTGAGTGRGKGFPRTGILPTIIDGRARAEEAWGAVVMGGKRLFPRLQHPGIPINCGYSPISRGVLPPKGEAVGIPSPAIPEHWEG